MNYTYEQTRQIMNSYQNEIAPFMDIIIYFHQYSMPFKYFNTSTREITTEPIIDPRYLLAKKQVAKIKEEYVHKYPNLFLTKLSK